MTFHSATPLEGITLQSGQAAAGRSMTIAVAFRVQCARILIQAGIDARTVRALLVVGAVAVRLALQLEATGLRVARISRTAAAHRVVVLHEAVRILAAVARIGAYLVNARFASRTVRVRTTAW